ncbi:AAA family ATPase [Microbispora bryophytorum]|uniref:AAA family ATPase n=1 Tax=Microbispora bryophytorum TaxID=1460882 RepID=UPI0033CE8C7A
MWLPGESLTVVGPPSVGKSTLSHMVMWGALGLVPDVLGYPIEPMEDGGILYLAMDRPKQIKRAMARFIRANPDRREEIDAALRQRVTIWEGPLPGDITADKRLLISMCQRFGRTRIVVDSIKDVLPNASDEARAGGYNIARQEALAEGLEWVELHHNRKSGADNKEPSKLDDVYGSRWITAGAGSVLSLFGEPGDIVLRLTHLKPLGEPILPTWVEITRHSGEVKVHEQQTPESVLAAAGDSGYTAEEAAKILFGRAKGAPSKNEIQNTRNKIKRLIEVGKAEEFKPLNSPIRYRLVAKLFEGV